MEEMTNYGDVFFTLFMMGGFLLWLLPLIFVIWFMITTVKYLKRQTALLEKMNAKMTHTPSFEKETSRD